MNFEQWLQSRLTAHGIPVGPIDGIIGKTTVAGIRAFQRVSGIPVSGNADAATVAALRESSTATVQRDEARDVMETGPQRGLFPLQRDVLSHYGPVGTDQVKISVPWRTVLAWDKRRSISSITVHRLVAPSAERAMKRVYAQYGDSGVKLLGLQNFGGSLNVRRMRGGSRYSMHSWGIAIDYDPERNRLKWKSPRARLSRSDVEAFWDIWEDEGWTSLGRERDFDWMHVQAAGL